MEWHPHLTRSLIIRVDCSMSPMFSFAAHVCRWAGAKNREGAQIHCRYVNLWWWNLYHYIWYSLALIPIWFRIFLCCCMLGLTWNLFSLILCVGKDSPLQRKIYGYLHMLVMFGQTRGQGCPWDAFLVLWDPSDCLALYHGYLGAIDGFWSDHIIGGNWTVSDLVLLDGFF